MADNVELNTGTGGAIIRTDDDGAAHWQYVKVAYGADDTQTIVGSTTSNPFPVATSSQVAHDAAVSGDPTRVGARARSSTLTAVGNDDQVDLIADLNGKQIVAPYTNPENIINGTTAAVTGTGDTSIIAAQGAGIRIYVTSIQIHNSHASVGTVVEVKDGTTVLWRGYAREDGGGLTASFPTPLRLTANTALNGANVTTGSNTYFNAQGYAAP